jgi:hypothetical protein
VPGETERQTPHGKSHAGDKDRRTKQLSKAGPRFQGFFLKGHGTEETENLNGIDH